MGCLLVNRAIPTCGTGVTTPREQFNENTAYIDGSHVGELDKLRRFRVVDDCCCCVLIDLVADLQFDRG